MQTSTVDNDIGQKKSVIQRMTYYSMYRLLKTMLVSFGACWHWPRGHGQVEPWLLAGDARCSPTSSWWVLETPMTKARQGPAGGQAGSVAAAVARSVERSGRRNRHMGP
jgi:hypothetical protein